MSIKRRLDQILDGSYLTEAWFFKKSKQKEQSKKQPEYEYISVDEAYNEFAQLRKKMLDFINKYKYKSLIRVDKEFKQITSKDAFEKKLYSWGTDEFLVAVYSADRPEFKKLDQKENHTRDYGETDSAEYWDVFFASLKNIVNESKYFHFDDETYKRDYKAYISLKNKYRIKTD